ncbi:MAG: hypothetical protein H7Y17_00230 [Chlorobia bacterium]|nr:hypothetical protein [Fimbriimonadaceae bacterium]
MIDPTKESDAKTSLPQQIGERFWTNYYYARMRLLRRLSRRRRAQTQERIPALVINYNRLTWPKAMCEVLETWNVEPILLDNKSTYPPLLEWYANCPYKVIRLKHNLGHLAPWKSGVAYQLGKYYMVSDPDLDLGGIPSDAPERLLRQLQSCPNLRKVGLGLEIQDLPDTEIAKSAREWESKFWADRVSEGFFEAMVDTTMALYDAEREEVDFFAAHRSDYPYVAKHLPWHQVGELTEEESYYLKSITKRTHWSYVEAAPISEPANQVQRQGTDLQKTP